MGFKLLDSIPKKEISFEELAYKRIAIDASNMLYQFLSSIRQKDGSPLTNSEGKITSHLVGLFSRIPNLMQKKIKLCFVFDGKPPLLKIKEQEEREHRKQLAEQRLKEAKEAEDEESMYKYSKQTTRLTNEIIEESKTLLKHLGLPLIQAPSEAEAQASFMCKNNDVWAVSSSDHDCMLYKCPRIIQNLTLSSRKKLPNSSYIPITPELVELEKVLNSLGLDNEKLLSAAILVGSVDYNEPIIIKNNGLIDIVPIGECNINSTSRIPCFDAKTKKISFKKVKKFIKHKINEPLYEITTAYNRKVRVTKSHSLFIKEGKEIKAAETTSLKKGDKLVIPFKIPSNNNEIKEINLARELWKNRNKIKRLTYCDGKTIQKILKIRLSGKKDKETEKRYVLTRLGLRKLKQLRVIKGITTTKTPFSPSTIYDWETGRRDIIENKLKKYLIFLGSSLENFDKGNKYIKKIKKSFFEEKIYPLMNHKNKFRKTILFKTLSKTEIYLLTKQDFIYGRTKNKSPLPSILKITPELARIIGYFLAEGHLNGNYRVNFSFALNEIGHDDYCVKDVISCIKKVFKTSPKIYNEKSTRHVCLDNCVIHDFFAYVLGLERQNSKNKKIPPLIFNINPELQLEFLKGLFLGDGSLNKDHLSFNTASYNMAVGLSYLFLQQGIISSTTFQNEENYNMKNLNICGKNQLMKIRKIWEKHNKSKSLINYCKKPLKQKHRLDIEGDLGYVKIKSITKVKPSNEYVYDFSVDGENFIAGFGGICCHNTDYNVGGVKGIGPKKALEIVKNFNTPAQLFNQINPDFDWKKIISLFENMPIEKKYELEWASPDIEKIKEFLVDKYNFSPERVENTLNKLTKDPLDKKQKGLGDFI